MSTDLTVSSAPARGMRDFLPAEAALRDWATTQIVATYEKFGFSRIETPALENIGNLRHGEGGENLKLIFEVLKRGDKLDKLLTQSNVDRDELSDLGLRFDLTVPLVRFYAHNQANLPSPFKSIQIGSVWRAESPQQGRYRQFTQCDIDIFGIKSEAAEMELIQATADALLVLGFKNFSVHLNDRRILWQLAEYCGFAKENFDNLFIQVDKLDKIGLPALEKELNTQGYNQEAITKMIRFLAEYSASSKSSASIDPLLPPNCDETTIRPLKNVLSTIEALSNNAYSIKFDPTLVRGMGYYTGQIFEIKTEGYAHSVAGGGRYDKMVGKLTGRDVAACGFSIGFERLISILSEQGIKSACESKKIALIYDSERDELKTILLIADRLRKDNMSVSLLPRKKEMKKQIDLLPKQGFTGYIIFKSDNEKQEIRELEG